MPIRAASSLARPVIFKKCGKPFIVGLSCEGTVVSFEFIEKTERHRAVIDPSEERLEVVDRVQSGLFFVRFDENLRHEHYNPL